MHLAIKMLQSIDGIIARDQQDKLDWGSPEDKKLYKKTSLEYGTTIVGSQTYHAMPTFAFKNRSTIILTRNPEELKKNIDSKLAEFDIQFMLPDPIGIVEYLKSKNVERALIAGGGIINSIFLESGLVNQIIITIAPKIFGSGVKVFGDQNLAYLNLELELATFKKLGDNELLLTYNVLK